MTFWEITNIIIVKQAKRRESREIQSRKEKFNKNEKKLIPENIDYSKVYGLRTEARQKLEKMRPENIGRASRISGVSPADVTALMIYFKK